MKQWVVLCLMALVALSGCFDDAEGLDPDAVDDDHDDQGDAMDPGDAGDDDNATVEATNAAPAIDLFEANRTEGEVPFDVRFDFNASDADGDDLSWTLDADGDGTADSDGGVLPFNFTFTFDTAGSYNATLNVSDGSNATLATVVVTASDPAEGSEEGEGDGNDAEEAAFTPIHAELEIIEGCELCIDSEIVTGEQMGAAGCIGWNAGVNELDCSWLELPPEAVGRTYTVDGMRTNIPDNPATGPADDMDPDVEFFDTCSSDGTSLGIVRNSGPEKGIVPEGAGCMVIMEFFWPNAGALHIIDVF